MTAVCSHPHNYASLHSSVLNPFTTNKKPRISPRSESLESSEKRVSCVNRDGPWLQAWLPSTHSFMRSVRHFRRNSAIYSRTLLLHGQLSVVVEGRPLKQCRVEGDVWCGGELDGSPWLEALNAYVSWAEAGVGASRARFDPPCSTHRERLKGVLRYQTVKGAN